LRPPETVSAASFSASFIQRKNQMTVRLYVGNLPFSVSEQELEDLFSQSGQVESANIVTDRDTGRSRGFAFVEMDTREAADAAIQALNGYELDGRSLTVNEARPKESRGAGRGGGFGGGGRSGGFGGGGRGGGGGYGRDRGGRGGNRY
jgi:RNA recognition motif-containing protein